MATSQIERESDRLERLDREDRRLRWDSALRAQVSQGRQVQATPEDPNGHQASAAENGSSDSRSMLTMLADRLERLERLTMRLDSEVRQKERTPQYRFQKFLMGSVVVLTTMGGGLATWFLRYAW